MRTRIIDFHTHLGDIFHENKNISFKAPQHLPKYKDPFKELGEGGYRAPLIADDPDALNTLIDAGQFRIWEKGSLQSVREEIERNRMDYMVSLPVLPNTSFEETLAASKLEPKILPFTSPDFSLPVKEMQEKLREDIRMGARGLKLHPILQNVKLTDKRTYAAVEVFGDLKLPVTAHCGVNDYYKPGSPYQNIAPKEYGALHYMLALIERYPKYILIPAHAGGECGKEYLELADAVRKHKWKHVYTDTSFKGTEVIKELVELMGEDKILFGTDYPFGEAESSIALCKKAFSGKEDAADKVFYRNAAALLGIMA